MPRNVRNFWMDAEVDGRANSFASGPKSSTGGMEIDISQRDKGSVTTPLTIRCFVLDDGRLTTRVVDNATNKAIFTHTTER